MADLIPHIDVNPKGKVKALVVWMHGLGDSGHGFAPLVPELKLADELGIRFVFPHAPVKPITINNNMPMRAWYDITSFDFNQRADEAGVRESAQALQQLIDHELDVNQLSADKLVIAGFSQGAVMAYHLGCRQAQPAAGILALSGYLAMAEKLPQELSEAAKQTPVLAMHGLQDEVVPCQLGKASAQAVTQAGFNLTWQDYPMQHNVCAEQVADISAWLTKILAD